MSDQHNRSRLPRPLVLFARTMLALSLFACAGGAIGPAAPRPNVVVAPGTAPASLALGSAVLDAFETPAGAGIVSVNVTGWRGTLTTAFQNAFNGVASGGLTLELMETELSFSPAAVNGNGSTVAAVAGIRFKARLLSADGQEVAALAGTVHARDPITSNGQMTANASQAVEALYETLVRELISTHTSTPASPAPATPAVVSGPIT